MKQFCLLFFLVLMVSSSYGQFVNNGATVIIQNGATLKVETNFINNTGGTITNNGTVDVTGDFTNNATFNSAANSLVKFSGTTVSNVTSGTAVFENVSLEKTNQNVVLVDAMSINDELNFVSNNNKVVLGANNLTFGDDATVVNAGGDKYVATNGTGRFVKPINANGSLTFEVGDLDASTNYSPVTAVVTADGYTNANLAVKVTNAVHPNIPGDAESHLTRYWSVDANGMTEPYSATLTGTYVASDDVVGTQNLIKGASYDGADWSYVGAATNNTTEVSGVVSALEADFTGTNFFGKKNLKVYLAGALPSGTTMTTSLNTLLPTETPYSVAPWNAPVESYITKPSNATDWILVELRDASNPATVLAQKSAWLLNNGDIVGLDGNPLVIKNGNPNSIVGIRHRNHLSIRTPVGLDLTNNIPYDFSTGTDKAYTNGAFSNANMRQIGSVYTMWSGNANSNTNVRYLGPANDNSAILNALSGIAGTVLTGSAAYVPADLNMNGVVRYLGPANDNSALLTALGGIAGTVLNQHF